MPEITLNNYINNDREYYLITVLLDPRIKKHIFQHLNFTPAKQNRIIQRFRDIYN